MDAKTTAKRKDSHLDLCSDEEVEPAENSTLLDQVHLVHCALPELALSEIALDTPFLGKTLRCPLLVTGMTGGTERAAQVNADLASAAEQYGLAFGVGSQRAMAEDPALAKTFQVRQVAPTAVLLGNLGLAQAARLGPSGVQRLAEAIQADGMAIHLNAGQELTQPEGDRDFRGGYRTLEALAKAFGDRLLVKETGCGISPAVARRLVELGVKNLDVSGLGGTSWIRVEQLRASGALAEVGRAFAGWGIPTAAAVAGVRKAVGRGVTVVASGGIRNGLEVAKALALGADLAGMALPLFRAQQEGGREGVAAAIEQILAGVRQALLLTGSRSPRDLALQEKVVTGALKDWLLAL